MFIYSHYYLSYFLHVYVYDVAVCMFPNVGVSTCVRAVECALVGGCTWRPETDRRCLQLLTTLSFETWSLTGLKLTNSARVAGQPDPGICLQATLVHIGTSVLAFSTIFILQLQSKILHLDRYARSRRSVITPEEYWRPGTL